MRFPHQPPRWLTVAVLAFTQPACSLVFVRRPPTANYVGTDPYGCTSSYAAPMFDTALAGAGMAITINGLVLAANRPPPRERPYDEHTVATCEDVLLRVREEEAKPPEDRTDDPDFFWD